MGVTSTVYLGVQAAWVYKNGGTPADLFRGTASLLDNASRHLRDTASRLEE